MYTQEQLTMIFNTWMERYASNPEYFRKMFDENGNLILHKDYGEMSAIYFQSIAKDLGF